MTVLLTTAELAASTPLKRTAVVPTKLVPRTRTLVPARPLAGEKLVITGGTKKLLTVVQVPAVVVTEMGPVVTPAGTVTVNWSGAAVEAPGTVTPLNFTVRGFEKCAPKIV